MEEASLRDALATSDLAVVRRWIGHFIRDHLKVTRRSSLFSEICAEASRNDRIAAIMEGANTRVRSDLSLALSAFVPGPGHSEAVAVLCDLVMTLKIGLAQQTAAKSCINVNALCERIEAIIDAELANLQER